MSFSNGFALPATAWQNSGGASLNLSFLGTALDSRITFTRSTTGTYFDSSGTLQTAAINAPRLDYNPVTLAPLGLLIEEQRTNTIRNNTMQGAVAGTPGTMPTNWLAALNSITGVSFSVIGTGTEKGVNYIDIRINGTPSATVTQGLQIAFDTNTAISASPSQTWAQSAWVRIVGGSSTNITGFVFNTQQYNAGVFVASNSVSFTPTSVLTRYNSVVTFSAATTTHALPLIGIGVTASAAIDITLRIGLPQLELGAFVTSVIPTTTSAVLRGADLASVDTLTPWFNPTEGTLYVEFICPNYDATGFPAMAQIGIKSGGSRGYIHVLNGTTANTSFNIFDDTPAYQGPNPPVAYTTGAVRKQIGAYAANNSASSMDGSTPITDTLVTLPTGLNCLSIGAYSFLGVNKAGTFYIRQIKYYPTRLSNASLQSITA